VRLIVTGATGYIGKHVIDAAIKHRCSITAASRRNPNREGVSWVLYDLHGSIPVDQLNKADAIIHLAANTTQLIEFDDCVELTAARKLLAFSKSISTKFIFVSSQTARSDAPTQYGRIKWEIEQEVLSSGGCVVRPGQVYGGREKALFGMITSLVRKMPVLPYFLPSPIVQPIHVDDLAEGLLHIAENEKLTSGVYCLAAKEPLSFSYFLSSIAKYRVRSFRLFIPVPVFFIFLACTVLGRTLSGKLGLDRLQSLFDLQPMETTADLERLNLFLRPIHAGMHPLGDDRRRRLLIEGDALFTYILKRRPGGALKRRYVRAVEQVRDGFSLDISGLFLKFPVLLSILDDRSWMSEPKGKELAWRLDAVTLLAEATTEGASSFIGLGRRTGPLINLAIVVRAVVSEIFWRIIKIFSYPLVFRVLRQGRIKK